MEKSDRLTYSEVHQSQDVKRHSFFIGCGVPRTCNLQRRAHLREGGGIWGCLGEGGEQQKDCDRGEVRVARRKQAHRGGRARVILVVGTV